jgi:hypothetical protein
MLRFVGTRNGMLSIWSEELDQPSSDEGLGPRRAKRSTRSRGGGLDQSHGQIAISI